MVGQSVKSTRGGHSASAYHCLARRATLVLANSQETAERVNALGVRRIRIFGESGADAWVLEHANDPPPSLEGPVRFASLTRLLHWKGVHLGLQAFARLDTKDAVYWVVGEGPEEPRLRHLVRELGIAERVEFLPNLSRSEWMDRLRGCSALVHPCIYNSGSAISLEAMAMGRPVICLDRGGIREQVTNDVGYRVRAENPEQAIDGLHRSMQAVIDDRVRAAQLGLRARERVLRHFSWPARGVEFDRVYRHALAAPSLEAAPDNEPHSVTVRKI